MEFEIKRLKPEDMDRWFELRMEALKDTPSAFLADPETEHKQGVEFFRKRLVDGGDENLIFGAFKGSSLIGNIGLVREGRPKSRHKAFIWGMYVKQSHRKNRVASGLLSQAISFAKVSMNVRQITLSVESSRVAAKRLYESAGFVCWGTEPEAIYCDNRYYDEDYMVLRF